MIESQKVSCYPLTVYALTKRFSVPVTILEKFPLTDIAPWDPIPSDSEDRLSRLKRVQRSMSPQRCEPGNEIFDDVNRPGDKYRRYRKVRDIPDMAMPFFKLAGMFESRVLEVTTNMFLAENAGIHLKLLVQRVYEVEGRLMKWNLEERRRQAEQGAIDSDDDL